MKHYISSGLFTADEKTEFVEPFTFQKGICHTSQLAEQRPPPNRGGKGEHSAPLCPTQSVPRICHLLTYQYLSFTFLGL